MSKEETRTLKDLLVNDELEEMKKLDEYWKRIEEERCVQCGMKLSYSAGVYKRCIVCRKEPAQKNKQYYVRKEKEVCVECCADISNFERSETRCEEHLNKIVEQIDDDAWRKVHIKKISEQIEEMPDYMATQFLKAVTNEEEE